MVLGLNFPFRDEGLIPRWETASGNTVIGRQEAVSVILGTITLDLFAVLLGGATALLPIYAKDILRVGPTGFGLPDRRRYGYWGRNTC